MIFALTLCWLVNASPNVVGYKVYYGEHPHAYTEVRNTNSNRITIDGLTVGHLYHFAVTTRDASDLESDFSEELSYLIPSMALVRPGVIRVWRPINRKNVSYVLESSETVTGPWVTDPAEEAILQIDSENNLELLEMRSVFQTPTRFYRIRLDVERAECAT
jgi:hypothetical protein